MTVRQRLAALAMVVMILLAPASDAGEAPLHLVAHESSYSLAPLGEIHLHRPASVPRAIVLLLSDKNGWGSAETVMARSLAKQGFLVAGASTPSLVQRLEKAPGKCINPNYALIALSRDVQHRAEVDRYHKPIVAGLGAGATLAFGALAQWPDGSYQGVISIDPVPSLAGRKPWCAAPGFAAGRVTGPHAGWRFAPNRHNRIGWIALQSAEPPSIAPQRLLHFVAAVPGARLIRLPRQGDSTQPPNQLNEQVGSSILSLLPRPAAAPLPGHIPLPDMPLTLVPATGKGVDDLMAIAYSGDGGWVGIDRDLATQLAGAGIPVVGIDSLAYFWTARTPQGAGQDLAQLIRAFSQRWQKRRVLLIGYSFGADVMPYMVDNLDLDARSRIDSVALLGLSATADFQFHLSSWLDIDSANARPTLPAIQRMKGIRLLCVRGQVEAESACAAIPPGQAQQFIVPGDHHFNRNAALLARIILGRRKAGFVAR